MYLDDLSRVRDQIRDLECRIASVSEADPRAKLAMSMPGISHITAQTIISELVDIKRFATPEKLVSYVGLVPSRRDSADRHRGGGITKQGSAWLRRVMVNSATVAVRSDPRMKEIFDRVKKKRGWQKAKVVVARHMTEVIWHMLTTGEEYRTQNKDLTQRKYKRMLCMTRSS